MGVACSVLSSFTSYLLYSYWSKDIAISFVKHATDVRQIVDGGVEKQWCRPFRFATYLSQISFHLPLGFDFMAPQQHDL